MFTVSSPSPSAMPQSPLTRALQSQRWRLHWR